MAPRPTRFAPRDPGFLLAVLLCVVLIGGRAIAGWSDLRALRLPDTDDVMRLIQVRDWLSGQGFFDVDQHRLGPAGTAMHWSRLGDLGPAAIILLVRPWAGSYLAETIALILWPAVTFLAFLLLAGALAARLAGPPARIVAIVLASLAWPAISLFVPGRIDHHGLQIVLFLIAVLGLIDERRGRGAPIAGLAIAASLTIGVENVVPIAVLCAGTAIRWAVSGGQDRVRLAGLSLGLAIGLAAAAAMAPENWRYPACDAFTQSAALAATCATAALAALALMPSHLSARWRWGALAIVGIVALAAIRGLAPACLADPYAGIAPALRASWLGNVEEAQPIWSLPLATCIGIAGLPVLAAVVAAFRVWRHRSADWAIVAAVIVASVILACVQARAIHVAAALAPVVLAPVVLHVRRSWRTLAPLAWLASIGISYPLAAQALPAPPSGDARGDCDFSDVIGSLAREPVATVLAPIDLGPVLLAKTPHRVIAAPYHRNIAGIAIWAAASTSPGRTPPEGIDIAIRCSARGADIIRHEHGAGER